VNLPLPLAALARETGADQDAMRRVYLELRRLHAGRHRARVITAGFLRAAAHGEAGRFTAEYRERYGVEFPGG